MEAKLKITPERTFFVLVSSILYTVGVSWFLVPADLFTAGFAGIALMISDALSSIDITINYGILLLILNIPAFFVAYKHIGKNFTFYSLLSVLSVTIFASFIPEYLVTADRLMSSIVGGVIIGAAVVFSLYAGASTGGMDIVSVFMSLKYDKPIGKYVLVLNGSIIAIAGIFSGIETALYTMVNVYVMSEVINQYHTRYRKQTLTIITIHPEEISKEIQKRMVRGITQVEAIGTYTGQKRWMLYTVVTNYEIAIIRDIIAEFDPGAFVNVTDSREVYGHFTKTKMD
jgi:uncharacterized membrane-anchored protein YitT (DUF2179 family)